MPAIQKAVDVRQQRQQHKRDTVVHGRNPGDVANHSNSQGGNLLFFKKNYKYSGLLWHRCASKEKLLGYFQRTANVRLGIPHLQGKLEYFQLFKILPRNCGFWLFVLSSGVISKAAFWIGTTWASRTQPFLALLLAPTCHPGSVLIAPERVLWTGTPCP